jgi:hypothetical protein
MPKLPADCSAAVESVTEICGDAGSVVPTGQTVPDRLVVPVRRLLHGDEHGHQGRADQQDSLTTAASVGRGNYPARQVSAFGAVPLLRLARPHWKPIEGWPPSRSA